MWKWIGKNEQQIKVIFTALAACFVVLEYEQQLYEGTVDRAITYVEKHDRGPILEARNALDEFWMSEELEKWEASLQTVGYQENEDPVERYSKELPELLKQQGMTSHLSNLMNFYKTVSLCAEAEHCHAETVCQYLFNDIQDYRENYGVFLKDTMKELGDNAPKQIERFVSGQCPQQMAKHCREYSESSYCENGSSSEYPQVVSRAQ